MTFKNSKWNVEILDPTLKRPHLTTLHSYFAFQINTNGILSFNVEFPNFLNVPFPLEFAAIAPLYSNIDTSDASDETSISYSKSSDPVVLQQANDAIHQSFSDADDFEATNVLLATWRKVGFFFKNNTQQNTFQVS